MGNGLKAEKRILEKPAFPVNLNFPETFLVCPLYLNSDE
jgi:hypothetical protein